MYRAKCQVLESTIELPDFNKLFQGPLAIMSNIVSRCTDTRNDWPVVSRTTFF